MIQSLSNNNKGREKHFGCIIYRDYIDESTCNVSICEHPRE